MSEEIVKLEAELVKQEEDKPVKAKKKAPRITLDTTEHYIKTLLRKQSKEQIINTVLEQVDACLLLNKEAALQALEKAATGDWEAMEMYKSLIQASFLIVQEREKIVKFTGIEQPEGLKPYQAPEMSQEEWEKTFKPQVVEKKKDELFLVKPAKGVN